MNSATLTLNTEWPFTPEQFVEWLDADLDAFLPICELFTQSCPLAAFVRDNGFPNARVGTCTWNDGHEPWHEETGIAPWAEAFVRNYDRHTKHGTCHNAVTRRDVLPFIKGIGKL